MDEFELELKRDFLSEARELLQSTEQSFLELEKDPNNKTLVDSIFRFAHNLKGTSRAVGFGQIAELTHKAENLLLEIKNNKIEVNDHVVSVLLQFNDKVREMIEGLTENIEAEFNCAELIHVIELTILNQNTADDNPLPTLTPNGNFEIVEPIEEKAPSQEMIEEAAENIEDNNLKSLSTAAKKQIPKANNTKKEDETLRVSLNRLEKLNDLVGELVILQALVESSLNKFGELKTARYRNHPKRHR
ncbi:MAG: Hpt domain-containing protein [Bacteriovoracaceae bacterium]